jgi:lysophospholipase L1-like esterase
VCYGDSNTWGYAPGTGERYPLEQRWTTVMQRELGAEYHVISEGLSGRNAIWDNPYDEYLNGRPYLIPCLRSHAPVDVVAIMLGTNDVLMALDLTADEVAGGVGTLVRVARSSLSGPDGAPPLVLVVAPPPVVAMASWDEAGRRRAERSRGFGTAFRTMTEGQRCGFLDAGAVISSSPLDGVHFDMEALEPLGTAVAKSVRTLLNGQE